MPRLFAILVVCGVLSSTSFAQKPANEVQAEKYRALVKELVSPNEPPTIENNGRGGGRFPKNYDYDKQIKVETARWMLSRNIQESLPYLIAALEDRRYCMTTSPVDGDEFYNRSVGQVCGEIIKAHLEIYREKLDLGTKEDYYAFSYGHVSAEWWKTRQKKSIAELQMEAIDWAIEKRSAREGHEKEILALQDLRRRIEILGKPMPPGKLLPMRTADLKRESGPDPFGEIVE